MTGVAAWWRQCRWSTGNTAKCVGHGSTRSCTRAICTHTTSVSRLLGFNDECSQRSIPSHSPRFVVGEQPVPGARRSQAGHIGQAGRIGQAARTGRIRAAEVGDNEKQVEPSRSREKAGKKRRGANRDRRTEPAADVTPEEEQSVIDVLDYIAGLTQKTK